MSSPSGPLALCADDYAQSPAISAGIRALVRWGSLRTVSAMSTSPHWPRESASIRELRGDIDLGLHFDLTHPFDRPVKPLRWWLLHRRRSRREIEAIRDEFLRQWDDFVATAQAPPDHLDGHQHIHLLPGVREGVRRALDELQVQLPVRRIAPAVTGPGLKHRLALRLTAGAEEVYAPFPANTAFAGFRRFSPSEDFPALLAAWMNHLPAGGLIMCHPGHHDHDPDDPIQACRSAEYKHLASRDFEARQSRFVRFSELAAQPAGC